MWRSLLAVLLPLMCSGCLTQAMWQRPAVHEIAFESWYLSEDQTTLAAVWKDHIFMMVEMQNTDSAQWQALLEDIDNKAHPRHIALHFTGAEDKRFAGQMILADGEPLTLSGYVLKVNQREFDWVVADTPISAALTADQPLDVALKVIATPVTAAVDVTGITAVILVATPLGPQLLVALGNAATCSN